MLTLGIRYLNGWAMATHPTNREIPEWPPHPDRVFMALAAAHFETDGDADERCVLEWLEKLTPPDLYCSGHDRRTTLTTYVPVNDSANPIKKGKPLAELQCMGFGRDRQARQFPVAIPHHDEIQLIWNDVESDTTTRQVLAELCTKVTHIGHSASLVQMWIVDELAQRSSAENAETVRIKLVPVATGRFRLRIPGPGRLADLESRYNRAEIEEYAEMRQQLDAPGLKLKPTEKKKHKAALKNRFGDRIPETRRPEPALWSGYDELPDEHADAKFASSQFANLIALKQVGGRRFGLESTLQLTQVLRATVMKFSGVQPVPEWLSGHQPDGNPAEREFGHTAFVPLPHVGSTHADGHLLGFALVPPSDVSRGELARALYPLLYDEESGRPVRIKLKLGKAGICDLEPADGTEGRSTLDASTWSRASTRWATVTPIALDRHPKTNDPWLDVTDTIGRACERIGLQKPIDVIPTPISMFVGAPTSREMPRIVRKGANGQIRQIHAIITFSEAVAGPMLLGAGRYRGYGVCRPLNARTP